MTMPPEDAWFVPRLSRRPPHYRKGFVPVTREGYRCFAIFVGVMTISLIAAFALPLMLRDNLTLGIILGALVAIAGTGGAMAWLMRQVGLHTDHTTHYDEYRARKRAGG